MNISVGENGILEIRDVHNPIKLISADGSVLFICMRDGGFEVTTKAPESLNFYPDPLTEEFKQKIMKRLKEMRSEPNLYDPGSGASIKEETPTDQSGPMQPAMAPYSSSDVAFELAGRGYDTVQTSEDGEVYVDEYFECPDCKNDDDCVDRANEIAKEVEAIFPVLVTTETGCHRHKYAYANFMVRDRAQ